MLFYTLIEKKIWWTSKNTKTCKETAHVQGQDKIPIYSTYVRLSCSDLLLVWISLSFRSNAVLVQQVNFKSDNLTEKMLHSWLPPACFMISHQQFSVTQDKLHFALETSYIPNPYMHVNFHNYLLSLTFCRSQQICHQRATDM